MKIKGYLEVLRTLKKQHPDISTAAISNIIDTAIGFKRDLLKK